MAFPFRDGLHSNPALSLLLLLFFGFVLFCKPHFAVKSFELHAIASFIILLF